MSDRIVDLTARKRYGGELTGEELARMISEETPDYQLAAFLMAVVLRGMSGHETADLLAAMVASGARRSRSSRGVASATPAGRSTSWRRSRASGSIWLPTS